MDYLSLEQVLFIHQQMIEKYGGSHGVRDTNLLEFSIVKPRISAFGEEVYPTLFLKVSAMLHALIKNHTFVDGNKRTAFGSMHLMLLKNGYDLTSSTGQEVQLCLDAAMGKLTIQEIASWIEKHAKLNSTD